ncbi:hypothetical protein H4219_003177 [Mycoemilia scoparia]|uniref:HMG box domain-containing protein n=1 Tax=Mycoemilia scoparia TaxID=417184 RepID=A0A9W8DTS0_9FUNG|nr:hypothetical protein H4219_003177 [Mycoemilia scoparia]
MYVNLLIIKCIDMITMHTNMVSKLLSRARSSTANTSTVSATNENANGNSSDVGLDNLSAAYENLKSTLQRTANGGAGSGRASPSAPATNSSGGVGAATSGSAMEIEHPKPPVAIAAAGGVATPPQQVIPRKRGRPRKSDTFIYTHYDTSTPKNNSFYTTAPGQNLGLATQAGMLVTPPTKRRGRPPRDLGSELEPTFALYAKQHYEGCENKLTEKKKSTVSSDQAVSASVSKDEIMSYLWSQWWYLPQLQKDQYLHRVRLDMRASPEEVQKMVETYPLPQEGVAQVRAVAVNGASRHHSPSVTPGGKVQSQASQQDSRKDDRQTPQPTVDAYSVFCSEQMPRVRQQFPDWTIEDVERRLAIQWKNMEDEERKQYEGNGKVYFERSSSAKSTDALGSSPSGHGGSSWAKARGGSRRAYVIFCRHMRPGISLGKEGWDLPDVNKELGRRWKELPSEEKEKYYAMERAESGYNTNDDLSRSGSPVPLTPKSTSLQKQPKTPTTTESDKAKHTETKAHAASPSTTPTSSQPLQSKGPSKGYFLFSRTTRPSIVSRLGNGDLMAINRELQSTWNSLSSEEKKAWDDKASDNSSSSKNGSGAPTQKQQESENQQHSVNDGGDSTDQAFATSPKSESGGNKSIAIAEATVSSSGDANPKPANSQAPRESTPTIASKKTSTFLPSLTSFKSIHDNITDNMTSEANEQKIHTNGETEVATADEQKNTREESVLKSTANGGDDGDKSNSVVSQPKSSTTQTTVINGRGNSDEGKVEEIDMSDDVPENKAPSLNKSTEATNPESKDAPTAEKSTNGEAKLLSPPVTGKFTEGVVNNSTSNAI